MEVVQEFLRERHVAFSATSWQALFEERILAAFEKGKLEEDDVWALLDEAEEHGRQHVFLYRGNTESVAHCMNERRVKRWAEDNGVSMDKRRVQIAPANPTITGVRFAEHERLTTLTIQITETRTSYEPLAEKEADGVLTKTWSVVKERAVNVVRLRADGLLELRVRAHTNSRKYRDNLSMLWRLVSDLIVADGFRPRSLRSVRDKLFAKKEELADELRYSDTMLRNDTGNVLTGATGSRSRNLWDDDAVRGSFDSFAAKDGATCMHQNVWWKARENGTPSRDVHVKVGGEDNEFAVPGATRRKDYEYVLARILRHGR